MFVEVVNNMRKKLDRWGTKDYNVQVCEYRDANQSPGEHLNYRYIKDMWMCEVDTHGSSARRRR